MSLADSYYLVIQGVDGRPALEPWGERTNPVRFFAFTLPGRIQVVFVFSVNQLPGTTLANCVSGRHFIRIGNFHECATTISVLVIRIESWKEIFICRTKIICRQLKNFCNRCRNKQFFEKASHFDYNKFLGGNMW